MSWGECESGGLPVGLNGGEVDADDWGLLVEARRR